MGRNHSACNQSKWLSNMWRLKNDIFTTGKLSNTKIDTLFAEMY